MAMNIQNRSATAPALLVALGTLTDEELLFFSDKPEVVKDDIARRVAEDIQNTYAVPMSDAQLKDQFPQFANRLVPWRKLAVLTDYRGPVVWKVKQGFTLKTHASLAGLCHKNLDYLQDWSFEDTPTSDTLVFWVPRLAPDSTSKTAKEMEKFRDELRARYGMPATHCTSFGSIALQFALILAHFKRTGERVPLNCLYVASDTMHADGLRLIAGSFDSFGLDCRCWYGPHWRGRVGYFLLGVEELGQ